MSGTIDNLRKDKVYDDISITSLTDALVDQSNEVEANRVDHKRKLAAFKKVPIDDVKKVYVPKYIDNNVTVEECHETHTVLGEIRRIGL